MARDFIRANLADPRDVVVLPVWASGPANDFNDKIDRSAQRAMADEQSKASARTATGGGESLLRAIPEKVARLFR